MKPIIKTHPSKNPLPPPSKAQLAIIFLLFLVALPIATWTCEYLFKDFFE